MMLAILLPQTSSPLPASSPQALTALIDEQAAEHGALLADKLRSSLLASNLSAYPSGTVSRRLT
jgi:hypothetical protein|tara:strand:+ start:12236 stop:12427 length:192 start_codon:yes stop_codon:yes gene_type:complete